MDSSSRSAIWVRRLSSWAESLRQLAIAKTRSATRTRQSTLATAHSASPEKLESPPKMAGSTRRQIATAPAPNSTNP